MKANKRVLAAAIIAVIGTVSAVSNASAAVVADGTYNLVINTTPTVTTAYGTAFNFGSDGAWNSSFSTNQVPNQGGSQGMTDNNISVASNGGPRGSSIGGDGWAGILGINVTGGTFTVNGVSSMGGTIDQTTGAMALNPTGRLAAFSIFPNLYDMRWNVDNCTLTISGPCANNGNTAYQQFSTVSASAVVNGSTTTIHGAPLTSTGAGNFHAILVSGGQLGSDSGGFFGLGYFEVWNIQLLATANPHSGFNVDAITGTCCGNIVQYVAPVPIPAAAWLFGSGLLGLIGLSRRQTTRQ